MMSYAFAAWTMKSVGMASHDMGKVCLEQFRKIMGPEKMTPVYDKCIRISTEVLLLKVLAPGALVILGLLVTGLGFGKNCCAGPGPAPRRSPETRSEP